MKMRRRDFFSSAVAAGVSVVAGSRLSAQEGAAAAAKVPVYEPKMEMLWKTSSGSMLSGRRVALLFWSASVIPAAQPSNWRVNC